uniref:Uncharacterized protein n=1 Tax=Triticum urartu TaxID=4572 RepID=A0A8R7JVC4_TRIUA
MSGTYCSFVLCVFYFPSEIHSIINLQVVRGQLMNILATLLLSGKSLIITCSFIVEVPTKGSYFILLTRAMNVFCH